MELLLSVTNMEEAVLTSPMKGIKHAKTSPSDWCIKPLVPPAPTPPLIILKIGLSGAWSFQ